MENAKSKWEMQKANGKQNDKCEVVKSQLNDFDNKRYLYVAHNSLWSITICR